MAATLTTVDEHVEKTQNPEFRLSARQRDLLRTLNTLFDEISPVPVVDEESIAPSRSTLPVRDVSRLVRD